MNKYLLDIIGIIAAILTTIAFLPQTIKTITTKCTKGISVLMYSTYTVGIFLWCVYGYYIHDDIVLISSEIAFILGLPILFLTIKNQYSEYKEKKLHSTNAKGIQQ